MHDAAHTKARKWFMLPANNLIRFDGDIE